MTFGKVGIRVSFKLSPLIFWPLKPSKLAEIFANFGWPYKTCTASRSSMAMLLRKHSHTTKNVTANGWNPLYSLILSLFQDKKKNMPQSIPKTTSFISGRNILNLDDTGFLLTFKQWSASPFGNMWNFVNSPATTMTKAISTWMMLLYVYLQY